MTKKNTNYLTYYKDENDIYRYYLYEFVNLIYLKSVNSDFALNLLNKYPNYKSYVDTDDITVYKFIYVYREIPVMKISQLEQLYFYLKSTKDKPYISDDYIELIFDSLNNIYNDNINILSHSQIHGIYNLDNESINTSITKQIYRLKNNTYKTLILHGYYHINI